MEPDGEAAGGSSPSACELFSEYFCIFCDATFATIHEAYEHYKEHMTSPSYCAYCDWQLEGAKGPPPDEKCSVNHKAEEAEFLLEAEVAVIEMWIEKFLSYQEEMIDKPYYNLLTSTKFFIGCPVCDILMKMFNLTVPVEVLQHRVISLEYSDIMAHVFDHLQYYRFRCLTCKHKCTSHRQLLLHLISTHKIGREYVNYVRILSIKKLDTFLTRFVADLMSENGAKSSGYCCRRNGSLGSSPSSSQPSSDLSNPSQEDVDQIIDITRYGSGITLVDNLLDTNDSSEDSMYYVEDGKPLELGLFKPSGFSVEIQKLDPLQYQIAKGKVKPCVVQVCRLTEVELLNNRVNVWDSALYYLMNDFSRWRQKGLTFRAKRHIGRPKLKDKNKPELCSSKLRRCPSINRLPTNKTPRNRCQSVPPSFWSDLNAKELDLGETKHDSPQEAISKTAAFRREPVATSAATPTTPRTPSKKKKRKRPRDGMDAAMNSSKKKKRISSTSGQHYEPCDLYPLKALDSRRSSANKLSRSRSETTPAGYRYSPHEHHDNRIDELTLIFNNMLNGLPLFSEDYEAFDLTTLDCFAPTVCETEGGRGEEVLLLEDTQEEYEDWKSLEVEEIKEQDDIKVKVFKGTLTAKLGYGCGHCCSPETRYETKKALWKHFSGSHKGFSKFLITFTRPQP